MFHKMVCRKRTRRGVDYITWRWEIQNDKDIGHLHEKQTSWSAEKLVDLAFCNFSEIFAVRKLLGSQRRYGNFLLQLLGLQSRDSTVTMYVKPAAVRHEPSAGKPWEVQDHYACS